MIKRPALVTAWCLLTTLGCMAHEDAILEIGPNDTVEGIPEKLGPVSLIVRDLGTTQPHVEFRAGGRATALLPCAATLIKSHDMSEVLIVGSWYHEESLLPYYVNVTFLDPRQNRLTDSETGYSLLFNLHNADLMEVMHLGESREVATFPPGCAVASGGLHPVQLVARPNSHLSRIGLVIGGIAVLLAALAIGWQILRRRGNAV